MTKKKLVEYKQMNKHSDHYWGQCCSKTVNDLVNFSSNWWATLHLKGILLSSSWGYPLKHDYDRCYLIVALEWMSERCIPPRSTMGPSILKLKCALHRMNMGDEHHWWCQHISFHDLIWQPERNPWERTLSIQRWVFVLQAMRCMSGWLDSFQEDWW
jgi:hypothetical protein